VIPELLQRSVETRIPTFDPDASIEDRLSALEVHMLAVTALQGEIASTRLQSQDSLRTLQREWAHLDGWQPFRRSKTEAAVDDAKRQLNPELYDGIANARWLIERYGDEFDRLGKEADRCSRLLTSGRLDAMIPHDFGRPVGSRS
jgi:hypothetical protein